MLRSVLRFLAALLLIMGGGRVVSAQDYPARPVKIMLGYAPGSGSDILARIIAEELRNALGQPFIVENRPGANGQIAAEMVAHAAPDGYVLLLASSSSHSINPHVYRKLPYDAIKDFTAIARLCDFPYVLVANPKLPIRTPQDLVDYARANLGKVSYAYSSRPNQVAGAALDEALHLDMNPVAYGASPPAMQDVAAGRDAFMVIDLAASLGLIKGGKLRPVAVVTAERSSLIPELPPLGPELGLEDFDLRAWTGLLGPAHLPPAISDKLSAAILQSLARPELRARLAAAGMEPTPMGPAPFAHFMADQLQVWGQKVKAAGIEPE